MSSTFRSAVSYHLYFAVIVLIAFWTYYQTFDLSTASTIATTGLDAETSATMEWMTAKQAWLQERAQPLTDLPGYVHTGITGVK